MTKILRQYQSDANDSVHKALANGKTRMMMVMATGLGKTVTAVKTIAPFKKRLWTTHTTELLEQSGSALLKELYPNLSLETMIETYGGLSEYLAAIRGYGLFADASEAEILKNIGIIKAEAFDIEADIVLASAQTLHRRLNKMEPDMFDAIVCDEAHLFASKTFEAPLKHFNPKLLLGLTATPYRADGADLAALFGEIVYQYNIGDGIGDGYLCEFDAIRVKTKLNLDNVHTLAGEFNQKELSQLVDTPKRNQLLLDRYRQYANGLQNIVFCVDVAHAQNVHQLFTEAGELAEVLVGDEAITPDRKGVVNRFKSGETTHLINVTIATAGFDHPGIRCITDAAPTKSLVRAMQKWGRGTRTLPGVIDGIEDSMERRIAIKKSSKPHCILLDIVDDTSRHNVINTWTLEKDVPIEKRVFVTTAKKELLIEARTKREMEAKHNKDARVDLLKLPEIQLSKSVKMLEPATELQLNKMYTLGFDIQNVSYTKGDANRLISNAEAPAKWAHVVRKAGFDTTKGVTRAQAIEVFKMLDEKKKKTTETEELKGMSPVDGL